MCSGMMVHLGLGRIVVAETESATVDGDAEGEARPPGLTFLEGFNVEILVADKKTKQATDAANLVKGYIADGGGDVWYEEFPV